MSNSQMVFATKYRLLIPESKKDGIYRNTGAAHEREKLTDKIVARDYVEERNAAKNHEFWVIDEEKTKALDLVRQENIKRQAVEKQNASATMGDLISALGQTLAPKGPITQAVEDPEMVILRQQLAEANAKNAALETEKLERFPVSDEQPEPKQEGEPTEDWSVADLRAYCDENGIAYHPATKEVGMMKLINESKESK
jgi:hypothetical protein